MNDKYFGSHEFQARDEVVQLASERNFGLVFAGFFALVGALSLYSDGHRWPYWLGIALVFGALALVAPRLLAPLNRLWAKFGLLLHMVISPLILALLFYVFIMPVGFLMRLTGKDLLRRSSSPTPRAIGSSAIHPVPHPTP